MTSVPIDNKFKILKASIIQADDVTVSGDISADSISVFNIINNEGDLTIDTNGGSEKINFHGQYRFPKLKGTSGQVLKDVNGDGELSFETDESIGEINTITNVGSGTGIYKEKVLSDLKLKTLTATSNKITLTNNTDDVGVDINTNNITSLGALVDLDVDNVNINGNTISTTNTNGDLNLTTNGIGTIITSGYLLVNKDSCLRLREDSFSSVRDIFCFHYKDLSSSFGLRYVANSPSVNIFHAFGSYSNDNKDTGTWVEDFSINVNSSGVTNLKLDTFNIFDSYTTLSSSVVNSSLTSTGVLNSGSINTGFGQIDNGSSNMKSINMYTDFLDEYTSGGNGIDVNCNLLISDNKYIHFIDNVGTSPPEAAIGNRGNNRRMFFLGSGDTSSQFLYVYGYDNSGTVVSNLTINAYTGDLISQGNLNAVGDYYKNSVLLKDTTETLTNKTISGSSNTITNIGNSSIGTGIDATKIADGTISNTEFQYLNNVSSNIQTQLNNKIERDNRYVTKTGTSTSTVYEEYARIIFNGTLVGDVINTMKAYLGVGSSFNIGSIRLYDLTNSLVICEGSLDGSVSLNAIVTLGTVSNLPSSEALFSLQIKTNDVSYTTTCTSVVIY